MTRRILCLTVAVALVGTVTVPLGGQEGAVAFVGARVYDGTGGSPLEDGVVVVREGRIADVGPAHAVAVPPDARRIDLAGRTLIPGLINAHGHVGETLGLEGGHYDEDNLVRQLELYAAYGFTSVLSLGGDGPAGVLLRRAQDEGAPGRARLFTAGEVVAGETAAAVREIVDRNAAMGADWIKIRVDDNLGATRKMSPDIYGVVIESAHEHDLPLAAHLFYLEDAKALLRAGADLVAHSIRDRPVDKEVTDLLLQTGVCYVPTLTREVSTFVYRSEPGFFSDPFFLAHADEAVLGQLRDPERQAGVRAARSASLYEEALEVAKANLKALSDAGVSIAFGTDTGPPARFQGYFEHMELALMQEAGMDPGSILRAATGDAARCARLPDVGTLTPGSWADLVVLGEDPAGGVEALRSIEQVWIGGARVDGGR